MLAGKTKDQVGDQFEPLLRTAQGDAVALYTQHNARASDAVRSLDDLDREVHLSYGDFPTHEYLRHIISFRAFRAHDIAKMIGADADMPDDIVQGLWDEFVPHVEEYRAMGVFPAALEVAGDADRQTKLLALVGRE